MGTDAKAAARVLTHVEAMQLFDDLAGRPGYVFNLPHDGCAARAHLMTMHMQKRGLQPAKAWAFEGAVLSPERKEDTLDYCTPRGHIINWWYHVAPAVPVQMPDGQVSLQVFDPAMFDGPVDVDSWRGRMGAPEDGAFVAAFGESLPGLAGWYQPLPSAFPGDTTDQDSVIAMQGDAQQDDRHTRWARKYLDKYKAEQQKSTLNRVVYPSALRAVAEADGYPPVRKGHGWVSHALYKEDPGCIHDLVARDVVTQFSRFFGLAEPAAPAAPHQQPGGSQKPKA